MGRMQMTILFAVLALWLQAGNAEETKSLTLKRVTCERFRPCTFIRCLPGYVRRYKSFNDDYYGKCYDCGTCEKFRPPCPIRKCPPIPSDCPRVIKGKVTIINGRRCIGCPRCLQTCPNIFCAALPDNCAKVKRAPVLKFQGKPCLGCKTCVKKCPVLNCLVCEPRDPKNPRKPGECGCPLCPPKPDCSTVLCAAPPKDCPRVITPKGQCCPICVRPCPFILCPAIFCPGALPGPLIPDRNGGFCEGCPICPGPCKDLICPAVFCENPQPGKLRPGNPPCRGCPVCPEPDPGCPVPGCLLPEGCDIKDTVPSFFMSNGRKCEGCPICPKPCEDNNCRPIPKGCRRVIPGTLQNKHLIPCTGCPRCARTYY